MIDMYLFQNNLYEIKKTNHDTSNRMSNKTCFLKFCLEKHEINNYQKRTMLSKDEYRTYLRLFTMELR